MLLAFYQFGMATVAANVVEYLERANTNADRLDKVLIEQAADEAILQEKSIDGLVHHFSNLGSNTALNDRTRANSFLTVAHLQWQYGRLDEAIEAVEIALSISESIDALMSKARLLDAKGNEAQADEWYAKAEELAADPEELEFMAIRRAMIKADEDNIQSLLALAETRDQTFKNRAAVAVALLGHPDKAIVLYKPNPDSEHYYRQLVRITEWALSALQFDLAKEMSWRAYDTAEALANRFYALALVMESFRRSDSLPELLPLLAERVDDDPDMRRLQVDVFAESELYDDAIEQYRSLPAGTGAASTRQELISLYESAGRTDDMVEEYQRMIESDPTQVLWYYGLARHYVNEAQWDTAREIWQTFGENNQASAEILVSGADYMLKMGFVDEATNMLAQHSSHHGPSPAIFLFTFSNHFNRGSFELAQVAVEEFESDLEHTSADLYFVADAYERLQKYEPAIDVYKKLQAARGKLSYDNRMRLAWLYSVAGQKEKALEEWQSIWLDVESPARRSFAESQLLMISAELAMIADIVIELEEKLFKRTADRNEINLLVRIYTEIGDDFSAKEVVEEYARYGDMDQVAKLKQLGNVYLQLSQYDKYDEVLKELEQIDPENRIEHIQNIVLNLLAHDLATERSEKYDEIQVWLEELRSFDREAVSGEFEASVLSMGGFEEEAIESYRRALIEQPKHSDNLLLMADLMKNLNRVDEAVVLLQYVAEHAEDDNEFVVAVDGIINMIGQRRFGEDLSDEHQSVFRWAHRIILERITGRDEKFYLYTLLSEIANETNNTDAEFRAIENSLPSAGLRRSAILRELMTMATPDAGFTFERNEGDPERQVRFGRRLIALRQELPPEVFINIGRTLLTQGDTHNAQKSFEMINDITGMTDVSKTTADLFFEEGFDESALSFYSEALATDQNNIELLLKMALLREFRAQFDVANSLYLKALQILLRSQPPLLANKPEQPAGLPMMVRPSVDTSVTREYRQFYEVLTHGLLMTWPVDQSHADSIVAELKALLDEELARVTATFTTDEQIPYSRYSRLNRIEQFLTRIAKVTSTEDLAKYTRTAVTELFEEDEQVAELVQKQHEFWGEESPDGADGAANVSRLQNRLDAAIEKGDLEEIIQLARLLGREELVYTELLKRISDDDIASAVLYGESALPQAQYRQLITVAIARLEDQEELLSFIEKEPDAIKAMETVTGRPVISADDLIVAVKAKSPDRQGVSGIPGFVALPGAANGIWAYLSRNGGSKHLLDFLEFTIDSINRGSDMAVIAEMEAEYYFDEVLKRDLTSSEQDRLYDLIEDHVGKMDLKDEFKVERTGISLVLKLGTDYSSNGELILRLADSWLERTQQDFFKIVDAYYSGRKSEALDHCIELIINGNHQNLYRFVDVVHNIFRKEISVALDEIISGAAEQDSMGRAQTLYRLYTNRFGAFSGYDASNHGHLPTRDLEKLLNLFPDDDEFAIVLILGLLRDGREIEAENKLRKYYETRPDDTLMRVAYYLQLIKNERFVAAWELTQDGGEDLADAEVMDSIMEKARSGGNLNEFNSQNVLFHLKPPGMRYISFSPSDEKRKEKVFDELRNSDDPQVIALNLRKAWRGSLVASATSTQYGFGQDFRYIYQDLSRLPYDPDAESSNVPYELRAAPTFDSILNDREQPEMVTLFQHLAENVAIGDEIEKYLQVEDDTNRKVNESAYRDLVDFYAPHPVSFQQRITELAQKLHSGRIGDHEFTLWLLLQDKSDEDLTLELLQKARVRFDAIPHPTRLQIIHFARIADSVGEFSLANDLYRLFVANATRSIHAQTSASYSEFGTIPLNLSMLVDQVIEFHDVADRNELLSQILNASARIDATPLTRALHDAFVLRSLGKTVAGAELLNAAESYGIDLDFDEDINQYIVPKAVELIRAHAIAGDFDQAVHILRTLLISDKPNQETHNTGFFVNSVFSNQARRNEALTATLLNGFYDLGMHINVYGDSDVSIRQQFLLQRERLVDGLSENWSTFLVNTLVEWIRTSDSIEVDLLDCVMAVLLEFGKSRGIEHLEEPLSTMSNSIMQSEDNQKFRLQMKLVDLTLALNIPPSPDLVSELVSEGLLNAKQRYRLFRVYLNHRDEEDVSEIAEILDRGEGGLSLLHEIAKIDEAKLDGSQSQELSARIQDLEQAKEALML